MLKALVYVQFIQLDLGAQRAIGCTHSALSHLLKNQVS